MVYHSFLVMSVAICNHNTQDHCPWQIGDELEPVTILWFRGDLDTLSASQLYLFPVNTCSKCCCCPPTLPRIDSFREQALLLAARASSGCLSLLCPPEPTLPTHGTGQSAQELSLPLSGPWYLTDGKWQWDTLRGVLLWLQRSPADTALALWAVA